MGMDGGGGTGRAVSGINVTPLIDVLLVLLIIFMLLVPVAPDGLSTLIPQPPKNKDEPPPEAIVVSIQASTPPRSAWTSMHSVSRRGMMAASIYR